MARDEGCWVLPMPKEPGGQGLPVAIGAAESETGTGSG